MTPRFYLLLDFRYASIHFFCYGFLFGHIHRAKLFAQVAVDDVLHWIHRGPEGLVLAPAKRRCLYLQVHLEMNEEVDVLPRFERDEDS